MKLRKPQQKERRFRRLSWMFLLLMMFLQPTVIDATMDPGRLARLFNATSPAQVLENVRQVHENERRRALRRRQRRRGLAEEQESEDTPPLLAEHFGGVPGFYHSVASGDSLPDAVILWTRYTPVAADNVVDLELRVAAVDTDNDAVNHNGSSLLDDTPLTAVVRVTNETDWIAKIDVTGLQSNSLYAFAFTDGLQAVSDIGLARTAPHDDDDTVESITYVTLSCAAFLNGVFHAYDVASTVQDLDFWIHVGDFIYEYGKFDTYARDAPFRDDLVMPDWETVSLADYRLRYASYLHGDVGLRNLRRRASMLVASWDDHELSDNARGNRATADYAANNHQPVCPVGPTASNAQKDEHSCDRDEGDAETRFRMAAQAYFEYMPLRYHPSGGSMERVDFAAVNRVREWGSLATFITLDTRVSHKVESGQTAAEDRSYIAFILAFPVAKRYGQLGLAKFVLNRIVKKDLAERSAPSKTIIGSSIELLKEACQNSTAAGKPWQIFVSNSMMGPWVYPNPLKQHKLISLRQLRLRHRVKRYWRIRAARPIQGGPARLMVALEENGVAINKDDWNGFHHDRAAVISVLHEYANNGVVLSGDVHDALAWKLNVGGHRTGQSVAVNHVTTAVTSPGLYDLGLEVLGRDIEGIYGGRDRYAPVFEQAVTEANPSLVFTEMEDPGFIAFKVTRETMVAEYFSIDRADLLRDYYNDDEHTPTVSSSCVASLTTAVDQPGSLELNPACHAVTLDTVRPRVYDWTVTIRSLDPAAIATTGCGYQQCVVDVSSPSSSS